VVSLIVKAIGKLRKCEIHVAGSKVVIEIEKSKRGFTRIVYNVGERRVGNIEY
jgi:hypothetical protein